MKVTVDKCPYTGQLFEDESLYKKHIRQVQRQRRDERNYQQNREKFQEWLAQEKESITSVDMIAPWFIENQQRIFQEYNQTRVNFVFDGKMHETDKITRIDLDLKFDQCVSNSHSCPRDGMTNWGGTRLDKNGNPAPRGYPGYRGMVYVCLERLPAHDSSYPVNSLLELVDIHTGTGGGANKATQYDCKIFLSDWVALEQAMVIKRLQGAI